MAPGFRTLDIDPTIAFTGSTIEITLDRAIGAEVLTTVQTTINLQTWAPAVPTLLDRVPNGTGGETLTLRIEVPAGTTDRLFVRATFIAP